MRKVYVVMGSCGEYSDHSEWFVAAFLDHEKAKALVLECTRQGQEELAKHEHYWNAKPTEIDPQFQVDYSGFNYTCVTIELRG